jgi:cytochrome b involved in lipid metabolism
MLAPELHDKSRDAVSYDRRQPNTARKKKPQWRLNILRSTTNPCFLSRNRQAHATLSFSSRRSVHVITIALSFYSVLNRPLDSALLLISPGSQLFGFLRHFAIAPCSPTMPGKILPTFTEAEVQSHNSSKSCYVIIDKRIYDVTDFLEGHPAGEDLILEYGGKDVKDIMSDKISHEHSDSAYDILEEYHIGFLSDGSKNEEQTNGKPRAIYERTGMADEADLSVDTDYASDYKTHQFIDLSKPMFPQIWFGGFTKEFYLEQVHRPRHYKGGESAPLFGNFLEPLSKTPWYVVPILWGPIVTCGALYGAHGLDNNVGAVGYFVLGLCVWTLLEYILHRFLFHIDK